VTAERRLAKLETALSPTELVLRWLDEAHAFDDLEAYTRWLLDQPPEVFPADRLAHEAADGMRASLRGRPKEEVDNAVRKALREVLFRFELVMRINVVAHETAHRHQLLHTIFAFRFATLNDQREDASRKDRADVDRQAAEWWRLLAGQVGLLWAMAEARTSAEARYLAGHVALFPDVGRRWSDCVKNHESLLGLATRMAELDGWLEWEAPEDPAGTASRVAQLTADLVEPARVMALEKLDEGGRALTLATRWLRPKLHVG